jgi:hypothetical protein
MLLGLLLAACSPDPSANNSSAAASATGNTEQVVATSPKADLAPVVVYSSRQEHLIKPLFDRFT